MLTDTSQGSCGSMLSMVPREGAWRGHAQCSGVRCLCKGSLQDQQTLNAISAFCIFS